MREEDLQRKLRMTKDELEAIKIYQGKDVPRITLSNGGNAYKIMNSLLFPGIDNEMSRIFIEGDYSFDSRALLKPEEILKIQEDLYAAMYKYGKQKKEKEKTVRFGRSASTDEMERRGEIVQNFSTSKKLEDLTTFERKEKNYFEVEIEPETICIDINEVLGKESEFPLEDEILIALYNEVQISEEELTEEEKEKFKENSIDIDKINKKIVVKVSPPPSYKIQKKLIRTERKDKEEKLRYLNDENNKRISCNLITKLIEIKKESLKRREELCTIGKYVSEEEILTKEQVLEQIDPEDLKVYSKWKEAYQTVLKYNIRERVNEIEKQNKAKQASNERKEIYNNIKEDELRAMTEECSHLELISILKKLEEKENIIPRKTNEYERGS